MFTVSKLKKEIYTFKMILSVLDNFMVSYGEPLFSRIPSGYRTDENGFSQDINIIPSDITDTLRKPPDSLHIYITTDIIG